MRAVAEDPHPAEANPGATTDYFYFFFFILADLEADPPRRYRQPRCKPPASFLLKTNEPFDPGKSSGKAAAGALLLAWIQTALVSSLNLFVDDSYPFGLVLLVPALAFSSDGSFPCSGIYPLAGCTEHRGSANLYKSVSPG